MNPKVDAFLKKAGKWREELGTLRMILLECGLIEELKWGAPAYAFQKTNVAILGGFKESCVLSFFKGALLKDPQGILIKPGKNTQTVRVVRFTNVREIIKLKPVLKAYIQAAIEVEKAGSKAVIKKIPEPVPKEFQNQLAESPALKTAFEALTPGRQRAYLIYISAPRQSKTRESRIEKCLPKILKGKGLNDR